MQCLGLNPTFVHLEAEEWNNAELRALSPRRNLSLHARILCPSQAGQGPRQQKKSKTTGAESASRLDESHEQRPLGKRAS